MQRVLLWIDRLNAFIGRAFGWSILALTLVVCYEVFARYLFGAPTKWAFDASYMLYGALFMMAGAYTLSRNAHVRGDFLYRTWRPRRQAWMDLILYLLFFFPGIIALIVAGAIEAENTWMLDERTNSPATVPLFTFKVLIPIVGVLMLLQGIVEFVRCLICIRTGTWPQRLRDAEETEKLLLEGASAGIDTTGVGPKGSSR
ncbi:MAG: TRAP transporter small permease subunit [Rhodospirillaceae bacterium]|nr:TRAP transporter small permease subunit [Rhodospirillaceae bacterium]